MLFIARRHTRDTDGILSVHPSDRLLRLGHAAVLYRNG